MGKLIKGIAAIVLLLAAGAVFVLKNGDSSSIILPPVHDIDGDFLLTQTDTIVSRHEQNRYVIESVKNRYSPVVMSANSVFHPLLFKNSIIGLEDPGNSGYLRLSDKALSDKLGFNDIEQAFSFERGKYLIVKQYADGNLYLIDSVSQQKNKILTIANSLEGVAYWENNKRLIISCDSALISVNLKNLHTDTIRCKAREQKLNITTADHYLLYSSNKYSNYHSIYKLDLNLPDSSPQLVYSDNHDLRMPYLENGILYFIEITNGEYKLCAFNTFNKKLQHLTSSGVVYTYQVGKQDIVIVYSDASTPKSLLKIDKITGKKLRLNTGNTEKILNLKYTTEPELKNTYSFYPSNSPVKGVVIFIHPGLKDCFSPRWDNFLYNICQNGYRIVAPNYPGSYGFGKIYTAKDREEAVKSIMDATNILKQRYGLPVFFLAVSSGSSIMEDILENNPPVNGAVSLFGIPNDNEKISFSRPVYFILGQQDRLVPYLDRKEQIISSENDLLSLELYSSQGHWFRSDSDQNDAVLKVLRFYSDNR